MRQRFTRPVPQVIFEQSFILIGVTLLLLFLAQPGTGYGATGGLRLTTTIDKGYVDSEFSEERLLEVVVQAPRQRQQLMIPFPPPPPFGLEALIDPSGHIAKRMAKQLRQAQGLQRFVAHNVRVNVDIGRGVCIDEASGGRYELHGNTITFHAGTMGPGESRRFLIRLKTNPHRPGSYNVGRVKMSYAQMGHGQRLNQVQKLTLQYRRNVHQPRFKSNHRGAEFVLYGGGRKGHGKVKQEKYRDRRERRYYSKNWRDERGRKRY